MILTAPQVRALRGCGEACQKVRATLEWLESMVQHEPSIAERVKLLRELFDHQEQTSAAGLALAGVAK